MRITITRITDIIRTDDGDYERDEKGDYGTTQTTEYDRTDITDRADNYGDWNDDDKNPFWVPLSLTDAVIHILTQYGCTSYGASHWQPNGIYEAESYQPVAGNDTWVEVTAQLSDFTEEESRAVHRAVTKS